MSRPLGLLLLLVVVVLGACPGLPQPLEAPQVTVGSASLASAALEAELSVVNPNHERLVVEAIDWELAAEDRPVARGRMDAHVDVEALAPAQVSLRGALSEAQARAASGELTISGTLHLRGGRGLVAAGFYGEVEGR